MNSFRRSGHLSRIVAAAFGSMLLVSACGSSDDEGAAGSDASEAVSADEETTSTSSSDDAAAGDTAAEDGTADTAAPTAGTAATTAECEATAALFVTGPSANPELDDPEVAATCDGDTINVVSNGVPDFTYIGTSPGAPDGREFTFSFPAEVTIADTVTDVPYVGPIGVTLNGIAIYGPTEGTGGDVDSLPGIISACGSHNGPGGFHTHKILSSEETDCWFTPEEVAEEPQLAGYAFDGIPIYTGIDQYTSSWQLTDEELFATDTWAAHTYVEGSGDLDQCNGRTDEDGNYAYYTTAEFPYLIGCFVGELEIEDAGGQGGGDRPERQEGDDGEDRPERPEEDDEDRPERPDRPDDGDGERPEPPAGGEGGEEGERPEPPDEDPDA